MFPFKKYTPAVILLFCFVSLLFSQDIPGNENGKRDSLVILLTVAVDTQRVNLLNQLSKELELQNPDESLSYANEAVSLSTELGYDNGLA